MPRIVILSLCLIGCLLMGGCHMMEGLAHDIEDASAYTGDALAEGGENFADWIRDLQDN